MSFRHMTPEKRREVARKGGMSVPREKRGFFVNRTLAVAASKISAGNKQRRILEQRKIQESNEILLRTK